MTDDGGEDDNLDDSLEQARYHFSQIICRALEAARSIGVSVSAKQEAAVLERCFENDSGTLRCFGLTRSALRFSAALGSPPSKVAATALAFWFAQHQSSKEPESEQR